MAQSMERWVGKVAIVTGASAGIGASIAEALVEEGLIVVGIARRRERIEQLANKLKDKKGKLYAVQADISKEEEILAAFKWIKENLGPVHILINNAAHLNLSTLTEGETKSWRQTLDVNVLAVCIATREAIKDMRANKINGHIIHINSIAGHAVPKGDNLNLYPASKHAITALTESLRLELNSLNSQIKITSLSPGAVNTEILDKVADQLEKIKFNEMPTLDGRDIANGVIYVLSTPPHVQVHELTIKPVNETF